MVTNFGTRLMGRTTFHAVLCVLALGLCGGYEVPEESVMEELFYEYNSEARPASSQHPVVKVSHQLSLTRIISLRDDLLVIDTWQVITWRDRRLAWDRTYYEDVDSLNLNPSKIWKPDIVNFDNAGGNSGLIYTDLPVTVYEHGDVVYIPPTRLTTQCKPNGPVYHCIWTFGSWTHSNKKMDLNNTQGFLDMSEYEENSRIAIIDSSVRRSLKKYACCPERYAIVTYNITIRWKDPDVFRGLEPMQMPKITSNINEKSELQNDEQVESEDVMVNGTEPFEDSQKAREGEGTEVTEGEEVLPTESDQGTESLYPDETSDNDNTTVSSESTAEGQSKEASTKQNKEQGKGADSGKGEDKQPDSLTKNSPQKDGPAEKVPATDSPKASATDSPKTPATDNPETTTTEDYEDYSWFG